MNLKLELTKAGYEKVFGDVGDAVDTMNRTFSVKINEVIFEALPVNLVRNSYWDCGSFIEIEFKLSPPKSKEEILAEEAVKKAEEALKAAKEVLSKVKEK